MVLHSHAFQAFFEGWLINQERYLGELLRLIEHNDFGDEENEIRCKELVERVMVHYHDYFVAKTRVVWENVFLVLAPPWFSSFERTYLWIGGFRPGLLFKLVVNNVLDLTQDQFQRIDRLMAEIKEEEKQLSDEFNAIQETMASPWIVELARNLGQPRNGVNHNMESVIDRLRASMEALVESADFLRMKTGVMLLDILKSSQAVRFLASVAQLQLRIRTWGMQRNAQNRRLSDIETRHPAF